MSNTKIEKSSSRKEKLKEKSSSFNGRTDTMVATRQLNRLNTLPNHNAHLENNNNIVATRTRISKLLLNVTVQGSVGVLHVVTTSDSTVGDLIGLALRQYGKEGRRPILPTIEPDRFGLHYSQFSLDRLDRAEKLINLGSRNFFICRKVEEDSETASSCSEQAEKAVTKASPPLPWLKFIDFLR